jgi:hypothetical protein
MTCGIRSIAFRPIQADTCSFHDGWGDMYGPWGVVQQMAWFVLCNGLKDSRMLAPFTQTRVRRPKNYVVCTPIILRPRRDACLSSATYFCCLQLLRTHWPTSTLVLVLAQGRIGRSGSVSRVCESVAEVWRASNNEFGWAAMSRLTMESP